MIYVLLILENLHNIFYFHKNDCVIKQNNLHFTP